jgi:TolB-like protein
MIDVEKGEILLADSVEKDSIENLRAGCLELANRIAQTDELSKDMYHLPRETTADYAKDTLNLAVSELEGKGISNMDAAVVTDFLRESLVNANVYRVIDRNNMQTILTEQKFQASGCTTEECAVKLGHILNVQKVVVGNIAPLGNKYYINIRLVSVEKGEVLLADSAEAYSLEGLQTACADLATRISKKAEDELKLAEKEQKQLNEPQPGLKSGIPNKWCIGLSYLGVSVKYNRGMFASELKYIFGDGFAGLGPRLYLNFNPNSNVIVYIGAEYCVISGKTELQKYTGTAKGYFIGLELMMSKKTSVFIDLGPYITILNSEFDGVSTAENDIIVNLGFNIFF